MADTLDPSSVNLEPPSVCLRDTGTPKGRGVFARCDFAGGTIVEECPVLLLTMPFGLLPPEVQKVVFNWGVLANTEYATALALGYGSLYNHDNPANMRYVANPANGTLRFMAVRDIRAGEELTINYNAIGGDATWNDDNWFDHILNTKPIVSS
jgi:SET domain